MYKLVLHVVIVYHNYGKCGIQFPHTSAFNEASIHVGVINHAGKLVNGCKFALARLHKKLLQMFML